MIPVVRNSGVTEEPEDYDLVIEVTEEEMATLDGDITGSDSSDSDSDSDSDFYQLDPLEYAERLEAMNDYEQLDMASVALNYANWDPHELIDFYGQPQENEAPIEDNNIWGLDDDDDDDDRPARLQYWNGWDDGPGRSF